MVILSFNNIFNDKLNLSLIIACVLKEKQYYKCFKKIYQNFIF